MYEIELCASFVPLISLRLVIHNASLMDDDG